MLILPRNDKPANGQSEIQTHSSVVNDILKESWQFWWELFVLISYGAIHYTVKRYSKPVD